MNLCERVMKRGYAQEFMLLEISVSLLTINVNGKYPQGIFT